jgi:hypothetical protein
MVVASIKYCSSACQYIVESVVVDGCYTFDTFICFGLVIFQTKIEQPPLEHQKKVDAQAFI